MSKLLQMIFGICTSLVFIGAVQIISPQKSMKRSVNYVLGVVFVLTLMVPAMTLKEVNLSHEIEAAGKVYLNSELNEYTAKYIVEAALKGAEINYENIFVTTDISEDNRILITKVTVCSKQPKDKIARALAEIVKAEAVEVINE